MRHRRARSIQGWIWIPSGPLIGLYTLGSSHAILDVWIQDRSWPDAVVAFRSPMQWDERPHLKRHRCVSEWVQARRQAS